MKTVFWQRLDLWARSISPVGLTIVLIILGAVPTYIPDYAAIATAFSFIGVFYWTVYRPDLFPVWAIFLVGLLQDLLGGAPIGMNTIIFLTVYGVVLSQRRFFLGKSFPVVWLGFLIVAGISTLQGWLLLSTYHVTLVDPRAFFFQYLMTCAMFPALAWMFGRWQHAFLRFD